MSMTQNAYHPDDERLAALAGAEPEAAGDARLAAHVNACHRCGQLVDELREMRAALAELPDIDPPRRPQLLPPVSVAPTPTGWLAMLRRLTAPAMAAAVVLIAVGAFGSAAPFLSGASAGAAPGASAVFGDLGSSVDNGRQESAASVPPAAPSEQIKGGAAGGATQVPTASDANQAAAPSPVPAAQRLAEPGSGAEPFGWLLGAGVILLAASFLARGWVARRSAPAG